MDGVSAEFACDFFVREGWSRGDVVAVVQSLVAAGLELPQPSAGWLLSFAEVDVVRAQLVESGAARVEGAGLCDVIGAVDAAHGSLGERLDAATFWAGRVDGVEDLHAG